MPNILSLLLVLLVIVAWRSGEHRGARHGLGTSVRRFFQYGMALAALVIVAVGVSGLLTRILQRDVLIADAGPALARSLSFTVVGIPLLVLLLLWIRRSSREDRTEDRSLAAFVMLALAELVPLGVFIVNAQVVLRMLLSVSPYDPGALAQTIVWGAVWYLYRRAHEGIDLRDYAGAALGLWLAGSGLAFLIGTVIRGVTVGVGSELAAANDRPLPAATVTLFAGGFVWLVYWLGSAQEARHTTVWRAYVLLAGVAGGLIAAVIAASTALYDVLVWSVGSPSSSDAAAHFHATPTAAGVVVAGALVWWYHRDVLNAEGVRARDEARRAYEYLIAGIGLVAAAVGLMILVVAAIESMTASAQIAGSGAGNTLLLAVTLLLVGGPVWWMHWAMIRRALGVDHAAETASVTRRVYLVLLFGVVGVAAVVALLVSMYFLFEDLVNGHIALETVRRMRWGIGILLGAGSIAWYHWLVFSAERDAMPVELHRRILLLAPEVPGLHDAIADRFHARVEHWMSGSETVAVNVESVLAAIEGVSARSVAVIVDEHGVRAVAAERD